MPDNICYVTSEVTRDTLLIYPTQVCINQTPFECFELKLLFFNCACWIVYGFFVSELQKTCDQRFWVGIACEQALGRIEWERKEEGPVCKPQILLFHPFFDISIIYAKYLAHNLGSATEKIVITFVDHFVTFNMLNCKNYLHVSIKLQFNNRNMIYQNKVYWQGVF